MARTEEPPVPHFDDPPLSKMPARLKDTDTDALRQVLQYETAHQNRIAVVQMLAHLVSASECPPDKRQPPPVHS